MNVVASEKFRWVSFLCAIFIALLHLSTIFSNKGNVIIDYYQQLSIPAMSFFFFSAAYFRFRNYDNKKYFQKIKKRVLTLLIPYVIWNIVEYVICVAMGYITFSVSGLFKMFIFVYIPGIDLVHEPVLGALWFLIRLLTYEIMAPLFYYIIKNKYIFYAVITVTIATVILLDVSYYAFLYWLPVYLTGTFLAFNYKDKLEKILSKYGNTDSRQWYLTVAAIIIFGVFVLIMWKTGVNITIERYLSIPVILLCMYLVSWFPKPGWLVTHGSFYLYCAHVPARMLLTGVLLPLEAIVGKILFPQVFLFSLIIIVFLSEWILYKICPKVLKVVTGGR